MEFKEIGVSLSHSHSGTRGGVKSKAWNRIQGTFWSFYEETSVYLRTSIRDRVMWRYVTGEFMNQKFLKSPKSLATLVVRPGCSNLSFFPF